MAIHFRPANGNLEGRSAALSNSGSAIWILATKSRHPIVEYAKGTDENTNDY